MKRLTTLILAVMAIGVHAQSVTISSATMQSYTVSKDRHGGLVFNGPVTFSDLNNEPSFTWLKDGREEYQPRESKLEILKKLSTPEYKNYSLVVFLGTWCSDSHYLVPKLEKVLDEIKFPQERLSMYGVDREKTTINGEDRKYRIVNVPTIILLNGDKEIGRITESVDKSIESDLAAMLQ